MTPHCIRCEDDRCTCTSPRYVNDLPAEPPRGPDGTPSGQHGRTGNEQGRGGYVIDMDTSGALATRAVRELADRARKLEDELEIVRASEGALVSRVSVLLDELVAAKNDRMAWAERARALEEELGLGKYEGASEVHPHVSTSRGGWINTYTGRKVYPLDLRPEDIDIRDIAHALALECRYLNHSSVHYSVAQHSVLLSRWVPAEFALDALLHDAEEAYLGDLARPLKVLPQFAFWREAGKKAAAVIQQALGIGPEPAEVKRLDHMMCGVEATRVMNTHPDWTFQPSPPEWRIERVWDWREAEALFLSRYGFLTGKRVVGEIDL